MTDAFPGVGGGLGPECGGQPGKDGEEGVGVGDLGAEGSFEEGEVAGGGDGTENGGTCFWKGPQKMEGTKNTNKRIRIKEYVRVYDI